MCQKAIKDCINRTRALVVMKNQTNITADRTNSNNITTNRTNIQNKTTNRTNRNNINTRDIKQKMVFKQTPAFFFNNKKIQLKKIYSIEQKFEF